MTNARRPVHLQLQRPTSASLAANLAPTWPSAMDATATTLPSQIMPHLFVGTLEQTNRETLNKLNISYVLSLGLLPIISTNSSPTSPTSTNRHILMPSQNSSKDFKIRIRTSGHQNNTPVGNSIDPIVNNAINNNENKDVSKLVRYIHCKCINIADNSEQILGKFFDEAHQFIDEARRKKCNILVHCLAGISRSPTIAIAYLMRVNSLRLQDAYNLVKQCRPQIDPNLSFMGQLMLYDKTLKDSNGNNSDTNNNTNNSNQTNNTNSNTCANENEILKT